MDPKVMEAHREEVTLLSKIFHPNVCLFMGACFEPGNMMIVTELLPLGDFKGLLYSKDLDLSLFTRVRMMCDAARGLTWLHRGDFVVIHRDLKPENLLVDDNFRVKVCDFGLSQVKEKKEEDLMDPKGRLRGSPLWMAPEVLAQQPFTQQADVYAFALVLWEAVTRQKPYAHVKTLKQLQTEVVSMKKRPNIPNDVPESMNKADGPTIKLPESLKQIIEACWAPEPADRPTMDVVVERLDRSLTDIAIQDENARVFWNGSFAGKSRVRFDKFEAALNQFLRIDPATVEENDVRIRSKCLRALVGLEFDGKNVSNSDMVHIEALGKVLHWLGPLTTSADFYSNLAALLSKAWFHGSVQTSDAEHRLADRAEGCFLIRFSTTSPGSYTISKVKKGGAPVHQRIEHKNGAFHVATRSYPNLELLLQGEYENLGLKGACPGSKYNAIFADVAAQGSFYVEANE
jgi:serine/threonine protein kinase